MKRTMTALPKALRASRRSFGALAFTMLVFATFHAYSGNWAAAGGFFCAFIAWLAAHTNAARSDYFFEKATRWRVRCMRHVRKTAQALGLFGREK